MGLAWIVGLAFDFRVAIRGLLNNVQSCTDALLSSLALHLSIDPQEMSERKRETESSKTSNVYSQFYNFKRGSAKKTSADANGHCDGCSSTDNDSIQLRRPASRVSGPPQVPFSVVS